MSQKSKFWQWIDHRVKVALSDNRILVGTFIAFDKHLNVVLSDTEEFRILKPKNKGDPEREIKRPLGLLIVRGNNIVSISAEKSPHANLEKNPRLASLGPTKFREEVQIKESEKVSNIHEPNKNGVMIHSFKEERFMKPE